MSIFIESMLVVIFGIMGLIYLTFDTWKAKLPIKEKLQKLWNEEKRQVLYCFLGILCGASLIIVFHYIYKGNTLIGNIRLLTLIMLLFPIAWVDYQKHIIPNKLVLIGIIVRIPYIIIEMMRYTGDFVPMIKDIFYAIILVLIIFILCVLVMKTGIGMGDIKLLFVMGLYQGISGLFSSLFMSLLITFFISIYLLIARKKTKKDMLPFAPPLLLGTLISIAITGM